MEEVNELQRLVRYGIVLQSFMLTSLNDSFFTFKGKTFDAHFTV